MHFALDATAVPPAYFEIDLPAKWAPTEAEAAGWDRLRTTRALAMVRGLFRCPIETWLLCDRAQRLREAGWQVRLGTFCPRSVTPRNGMIVAWT